MTDPVEIDIASLLRYTPKIASREGNDYITPVGSIYGRKVMIINEYAGSGGDMMPWLFRAARIGPLIGMRTWGGLVGMAGAASGMPTEPGTSRTTAAEISNAVLAAFPSP